MSPPPPADLCPKNARRSEPARPGMRDVADRAGVAVSSVSRVLAGTPGVSPLMRNRVLDAVAALGFEPNLLAQSLRRGATMTVGFIVGDISNPLISLIALGAETALRDAGYSMLLTNSGTDPAVDAQHISLLKQRQVDGLLLSLADDRSDATVAALKACNIPSVLVDREVAGLAGSATLVSDHAAAIREAVRHLADLGHTSIALVNGSSNVRPARERAAALRQACRSRSGISAMVRSGDFGAAHGLRATLDLLAAARPPTAIIAGGNQILLGVLRALVSAGIRVPADMSLVTCDDVPFAEFLTPPLATLARDPEEMGRMSATLLLELLAGSSPERTVLPVRFRPGASCAVPPRPR